MENNVISLSKKAEEYLEMIHRLEEKRGVARTSELAHQLKIVPGSVTNTIANLEKRGLVTREPYKGVTLTEKGRKYSLKILRKHRLAERLLTDILHLDWSKSHKTACELEHAIPEDMVKHLEKVLNHPQTCPHGNPIPTNTGMILEEETEPLSELEPGESRVIAKITKETPAFLKHIENMNIKPRESIQIVNKNLRKNYIIVEIKGNPHTLDLQLASEIKVKKK